MGNLTGEQRQAVLQKLMKTPSRIRKPVLAEIDNGVQLIATLRGTRQHLLNTMKFRLESSLPEDQVWFRDLDPQTSKTFDDVQGQIICLFGLRHDAQIIVCESSIVAGWVYPSGRAINSQPQ